MDKLIKYLKDKQHLSDEAVKVVLNNIKVKYVVPTYYFDDLLFTDLNVLDDIEDDEFYNIGEFNEIELNSLINKIIINKGFHVIPKKGFFSHLKIGEEYWAIYKNAPPINVVIHSIEEKVSGVWHTYNYIVFINKENNKIFSFWDKGENVDELFLFSTRQEAVTFYKDKFNLN